MSANPIIYCLQQLTDYRDFEILCSELMIYQGYNNIEPLGGFNDFGRDAIHLSEDKVISIFAYSVREDWKIKLGQDSKRVNEAGISLERLVFVTTSEVSPRDRDYQVAVVKEKYNWELEIYDITRLKIILSTIAREVLRNYPGIFPPKFVSDEFNIDLLNDLKADVKSIRDAITGGDSYCYSNFNIQDDSVRGLLVTTVGVNPLKNVRISILDCERFKLAQEKSKGEGVNLADFKIIIPEELNLPSGNRKNNSILISSLNFGFLNEEENDFIVEFSTLTKVIRQKTTCRKVQGKWIANSIVIDRGSDTILKQIP